jgi:hypothetical protein
MRLRNLVIFIFLALGLVGCKNSTSAEPTATEVPPEPTQVPEPTSIPVIATRPPATCTVVSMRPEDQENQESPFPAVSKDDWIEGPESASVTIIEYGDYQ